MEGTVRDLMDLGVTEEEDRITALRRSGLLDTAPEERFDRLVRLAAAALDVPIALVSLVDEHRQWFKARVGLDATETPREQAFCAHTIAHVTGQLVVADATSDPRFADNPLVTSAPDIRAYAGHAISDPDGHRLGTICAIDRRPRDFDPDQLQLLADVAALVERELASAQIDTALTDIQQRARRVGTLLATVTDGFIVHDPDWRITEWNQRALELLGLDPTRDVREQLQAIDDRCLRPDGRLIDPDHHAPRVAMRTGERVLDWTIGVPMPDGTTRWLVVNCHPVLGDDRRVAAVVTLFADAGEYWDARTASETMSLQMRQAIDASPVGTALLNAQQGTIYLNDSYAQILGIDRADLEQRSPISWVHRSNRPDAAAFLGNPNRVATDRIELRVATRDRSERYVRLGIVPLTEGDTGRYIVQIEDITEERELRAALNQSEEVARISLDLLDQGVLLGDSLGRIHRINPAAERILGLSPTELRDAWLSGSAHFCDEHGNDLDPDERPVQRVLRTGAGRLGEVLGWRRPDGRQLTLRVSCVPLPDAQGTAGRFVLSFTDVTAQRALERLLDQTLTMAPVGIAVLEPDGTIVRSNARFLEHAGDLTRGGSAGALLSAADDVGAGAPGSRAVLHIADRGADRWIELLQDDLDDRDLDLLVVATVDISEARQMQLDLERYRQVFMHSNEIILVVDAEGQPIFTSPSNERVLGYPHGFEVANGFFDFVHPDDLGAAIESFGEVLSLPDGESIRTVARVMAYDGSVRHLEANGTRLLDDEAIQGVVLIARDVTDRQELLEQLEHQAAHDALTDLPNRIVAEDQLVASIARARRSGGRAAVCMLDLDRFKAVNDTHGHAAGDEVLREVARRLRSVVRLEDTPARIGGDEFVTVLDPVASADEAVTIARRIRDRLVEPPIEVGDLRVSVSVGVAVTEGDEDAKSLTARADAALYRAKERRDGSVWLAGADAPS